MSDLFPCGWEKRMNHTDQESDDLRVRLTKAETQLRRIKALLMKSVMRFMKPVATMAPL